MTDDQERWAPPMDETPHHTEIDDRYLTEWFEFGFREMRAYLDKQARFARYLNDRDADA